MSIEVVAHRGSSARQPEMTVAAYRDAIDLARETGSPVTLECDVHFSRDRELICLHDLDLRRTAGRREAAADLTVRELKRIDFGSWATEHPTPEQQRMVTLPELFGWVRYARSQRIDVGLSVETKHPNPGGLDVDRAVVELIRSYGWADADSPVRMISFSPDAVALVGAELPELKRSFLVDRSAALDLVPPGVDTVGVWLELLRQDPQVATRVRQHHQLAVWTVNDLADVEWCLDAGAVSITTDVPERVLPLVAEAY